MPLGIDATLRYGPGIRDAALTRALRTRRRTTAVHKGLPPTPIGSSDSPRLSGGASGEVDYPTTCENRITCRHSRPATFCRAAEYGYRAEHREKCAGAFRRTSKVKKPRLGRAARKLRKLRVPAAASRSRGAGTGAA